MQLGDVVTIRRSASFLAVAGIVDYGLQILLPIVLARTLSPEAFGDYRLVWLVAATAVALFPTAMPLSLFSFLPGASASDRAHFLSNTMVYLIISALLASSLIAICWAWFPDSVRGLQRYGVLVPVFVGLWIVGSLVEVMPTADGNARWQAQATIGLALFRAAALGLAAFLSRDITTVLVAMCILALIKALLSPAYALTSVPRTGFAFDLRLLVRQLRYALPFAVGNALFLLRGQADQWIVAAHFPPDVFVLISIAAVVMSVSTLVRHPLNNATLPRLRDLVSNGALSSASELLGRAYSALSLVLLPLLGLLLLAADEIVELMYTRTYIDASPLMQLYLLGQMTGVFAAGHLLVIVDAGRLSTIISAVCLAISIACSLVGVYWFGLPGAVAGSVISLIVGEVWALLAVTRRLDTTLSRIVNWQVTGRAIATVIVAIVLIWGLREVLPDDFGPWSRIALTTVCYCIAVTSLGAIAGLHRSFLPLLPRVFKRSS